MPSQDFTVHTTGEISGEREPSRQEKTALIDALIGRMNASELKAWAEASSYVSAVRKALNPPSLDPVPWAFARAPVHSRWMHQGGGAYTIVAHGQTENDGLQCVVYRKDGETDVWVRSAHEFFDGRFTPICPLTEF
jgi:hypothetical protein